MKLSVVIPAHNEAENLPETLETLYHALITAQIPHEIVVVNDGSTDTTQEVLLAAQNHYPTLRSIINTGPHGFGLAIQTGLKASTGEAIAIMMADLSDSPEDLIAFYQEMQKGFDCVFGSRWQEGGQVIDYPLFKRGLNRLTNFFIRILFGLSYNDVTNAFKLYKAEVIKGCAPILSSHFNLTVELPLKAIIRGYSYTILPNSWRNRKYGESKLKIKEMGSRYLFIILYCFIEKWLSRGDYKRA